MTIVQLYEYTKNHCTVNFIICELHLNENLSVVICSYMFVNVYIDEQRWNKNQHSSQEAAFRSVYIYCDFHLYPRPATKQRLGMYSRQRMALAEGLSKNGWKAPSKGPEDNDLTWNNPLHHLAKQTSLKTLLPLWANMRWTVFLGLAFHMLFCNWNLATFPLNLIWLCLNLNLLGN